MENVMIKIALMATILVLMLGIVINMSQTSQAGKSADQNLAHMVYFTLNDNSPEAVHKLVEACNKYLNKHDGEVYFSVGTRVKDLKREVNDQDFDVALHVVFQNRAAHDKYQDHPRHIDFIKENRANWKKVRVFDANVSR
jgi:Stress responsive A/B Barrel Domain